MTKSRGYKAQKSRINPDKMPGNHIASPTLLHLPPEILSQIISHLPTARALRNIGLSCRKLHHLVETDGWKHLVTIRFPSFQVPPQWKDAAHTLTSLSRNLDRKAFIAHHFEPIDTRIVLLPAGWTETVKGRWRRPQGQTMGYQPVIDSYEEWASGDWTSRTEVVAYGAGARLVLRNKAGWTCYQDPLRHREGRDDITTVNLLRSDQISGNAAAQKVIVGRASGDLRLLGLDPIARTCTERQFATARSLVRSADLSVHRSSLLAACLGDGSAVIYSISGDERRAEPLSQVQCIDDTEPLCRTWSARFLSDSHLAIGRGPSAQIVQVYNIGSQGISKDPVRVFGTGRAAGKPQTSAYPLCSLPHSSIASASTGNVFLSGGYDGCIRIHDMRSPSDCEVCIWDPTDFAGIYSLAMVGRERIVAGGAINALLKCYDLRAPGGRIYDYLDTDAAAYDASTDPANFSRTVPNDSSYGWKGWNIFASAYDMNTKSSRRMEGGPIYSLSRPSSASSSLYVGREGSVIHFNISSMLDRHPDPVYAKTISRGQGDVQRTWDPQPLNCALRFSMYEQTESGNMPLRVQSPVSSLYRPGLRGKKGWDERWIEAGQRSS